MKVEKVVTPPPPPPPPEQKTEYVITLSQKEAENLMSIVGCIGGICEERHTTDELWELLRGLDVAYLPARFKMLLLERIK